MSADGDQRDARIAEYISIPTTQRMNQMNVLALMDELEQLEIMLLDTDAFSESPVSRRIREIEDILAELRE